MKIVKYLSKVDKAKCIGDKLCEKICPSQAIQVVNKKAVVDESKCVACGRCEDICKNGATCLVPRPEPKVIFCDLSDVDEDKIKEICRKAHIYPMQFVCPCTGTLAEEVAGAIIKGAKSLEEVTIMTGARSGCGMYCHGPILRLLHAAGVEVQEPKDHRWYDLSLSIWDISKEMGKKYSSYYIDEDKEALFKKRTMDKL